MSLEAPSNNQREGGMFDRFRNEVEVLERTITPRYCELLARGNTVQCDKSTDGEITLTVTRGDHSEPFADWHLTILKEVAKSQMDIAATKDAA